MPALFDTLATPLGELLFTSDGDFLIGLTVDAEPPAGATRDRAKLKEAVGQMRAYLAGELTDFDLPLAQPGTAFQQSVWAALRRIPFGETISYQQLAGRVGKPKAYRAAGSANGRNQLIIVVPCHRVIAADGTIGGYGGGLWRKEWLLRHEQGG
jgi:methylated-DNA-[protein]-cysteine S-methyltransferase